MDDLRLQRLNRFFNAVINDNTRISTGNAALFVESVCSQLDHVTCAHKIVSSKAGLASLQKAIFRDLSDTFINGPATQLLNYLQESELEEISSGDLLRQIIIKIVEPPIFWHPFLQCFKADRAGVAAQRCFAWLLLQLISLPGDSSSVYQEVAKDSDVAKKISQSSNNDARALGYKIQHIINTRSLGAWTLDGYAPGGRHDNDFADYREIAILPTADELLCKERPFLRTVEELKKINGEQAVPTHLDNHFRLYREDMLNEMREELQVAFRLKKGRHRGLAIENLKLLDSLHRKSNEKKSCKWGIKLLCKDDLWFFRKAKKDKPEERKKILNEEKNRRLLKHQSLACLIVDDDIIAAFASINRNEDLLSEKPPIIVLQLEEQLNTVKALSLLMSAQKIKMIQIDTAVFAYEHVLRGLQRIQSLPLSSELICWNEDSIMEYPLGAPHRVIEALEQNPTQDLKPLLNTSKSINLDNSQMASLLSGLTQRVSLIQGPPGTGKSFIGALIAKILHDKTTHTILVCCYTNHALDQFLEDLLDIGIPQSNIVRLGGKATPKTEPLSISKQTRIAKFKREDHQQINSLKNLADESFAKLEAAFELCQTMNVSDALILTYLEFKEPNYFSAFRIPSSNMPGDMKTVGRGGRAVTPTYLLHAWCTGRGPGIFINDPNVTAAAEIWEQTLEFRHEQLSKWRANILKERVDNICNIAKRYNSYQSSIEMKFSESDGAILRSKRIIGCTTTAAAKYSSNLAAASPDVLLVEEAGEILESHVLTALGKEAKQLILIGDHKQLRPKVNNYLLTVEKDEGYELNRSLFERLVLKGLPHCVLSKQHRMRPEIASLVRHLTYPELTDADGTKNRPNHRGVRDNIVFVNHELPEDELPEVAEFRDAGAKSSKQNTHEVEMVLKIVRYLGQQGYGTDKVVILTPYLGQLFKFMEALKKDNDPVLNDMDSYDLVQAGVLPASVANVQKKPIRLATIDNYQGEESDIVVVSLTRSNSNHDIGFMSSPQRVNVLLSRARNALIMIGNSETFIKSRIGGGLWSRLINLLKEGGHLYEGLPVKCERHPDRSALLSRPEDFDNECPDGGCKEACKTLLNCGIHSCPSKCHQLHDHSKIRCEFITRTPCSNGHNQSWKCYEGSPVSCGKCEREAKKLEEKRRIALEMQRKKEAEEQAHLKRILEIDVEIASERQKLSDMKLAEERKDAILQKMKDLEDVKARVSADAATADTKSTRTHTIPVLSAAINDHKKVNQDVQLPPKPLPTNSNVDISTISEKNAISTALNLKPSPSQIEWQREKDMEGASNEHVDAIMDMVGLESVKEQVLTIKNRVELCKRQNTSLSDERFNVVFLGNPGTGKTTVARHYAKFLSSVGVLPGETFFETTGSRLANDGIPGAKKLIEATLKDGGGAIFVDEAYQLKNESNFGGGQVLDFLLAEMENNIGKIIFILAGYSKQMEKFFEHNPGLSSRVPYTLKFADYSDDELLIMLEKKIGKKWQHRMQVEEGIAGLYGRITVRRLGRGRGKEGFGNARALENLLSKISDRQTKRIANGRKKGQFPNDFLLTKEDLIGPDPSEAVLESSAWKKLQAMVGLKAVKESVKSLFDMINENYQRELREKEPIVVSLNRVFLGSPGTGKTTVAKLYGAVLVDLGLLSSGEVIVKNPADFVGNVLGQSESNTKAILASTVGKVLVIDEAYMLYGGSSESGGKSDLYKTAVIDTIVAEVQNVPGEDRCVLMLGYETQMREMFQNVNPGLSRRFAIEEAFRFDDFNDSELREILDLKLDQQDLLATNAAKDVAITVLSRARNRPNFGNGGEVENILTKAKVRYQARQANVPANERCLDTIFEPQDFDAEFDRLKRSSENLDKLFEDVIGCDAIKQKLADFQNIARTMIFEKAREIIPTNFVFKGPPGTGKTTTARKFGQVYYDMGFLSSCEVIECSASDLVGTHVGHTGPKTKKLFEKALGRVLFIDEAYRLSEGPFAKEAIDEVVGILTSQDFASKLIVILAGYDQDMNKLLAVNSGLSSRFPEEINFENLLPEHCLDILRKELKKMDIDSPILDDDSSVEFKTIFQLLSNLSELPSWGNARDIKTLAKQIIRSVVKRYPSRKSEEGESRMMMTGKDAVNSLETMLKERHSRANNIPKSSSITPSIFDFMQQISSDSATQHALSTNNKTRVALPKHGGQIEATSEPMAKDTRDPGVSDTIWNELQRYKQQALDEAKMKQEKLMELQRQVEETRKREEADKAKAKELELAQKRARDAAAVEELKRKQEEVRLRELAAYAERQRLIAELEARRKKEEEERRLEAKVQQKLRTMGVCPVGFQWIKMAEGYRCAGGSHYIMNAEIGI